MCGIAGFTGAPDRAMLGRMASTIAHRGPDQEGVFESTRVSLVARRLAIVDPAGGDQPRSSEDGQVRVVFNGEIYDHLQRARTLRSRGHVLASRSDTEIIAHLYEEEGLELPGRLRGMFALALWDEPRGRLLLARDRFGEKPLFYSRLGDRLVFASEIKALLAAAPGTRILDSLALEELMAWGHARGDRTLLAGIRKLPAAHRLIWEDGRVQVDRYWSMPESQDSSRDDCAIDPDPGASAGPDTTSAFAAGLGRVASEATAPAARSPRGHRSTADELAVEILLALDESVRLQSAADVPVGCFLSGGLDSSIVAALMARHVRGRLATFCVGVDAAGLAGATGGAGGTGEAGAAGGVGAAGEADERPKAREVSRLIGSAHHELLVPPPTGADLVRLALALDAPPVNPATWPTFRLAEQAGRTVRVVLCGEGADELFGGYGKYVYPYVHAILGPTAVALLRPLVGGLSRRFPRWRTVERLAGALAADTPDQAFDAVNSIFPAAWRRALLAPQRRRISPASSWRSPSTRALGERPASSARHILERMTRIDLSGYLAEDNLVRLDRATMAHGIEARAPFLDPLLAERLLRSGVACRVGWPSGKSLLRRVARLVLPPAIAARPKRAFDMPIDAWLSGPLRPAMEAATDRTYLLRQGLFAPDAVAALERAHGAGRSGAARGVWTLLAFQLWHAAAFEGVAHSPLIARVMDASSPRSFRRAAA